MSVKNRLVNKQKRRAEREERKAFQARIATFTITEAEAAEFVEEPRVSELVIAETPLWTPGKEA